MVNSSTPILFNSSEPFEREATAARAPDRARAAFAGTTLDWDLLEFARSWVRHEPEMGLAGNYGLVFVMRIVLRLKPSVLRRWHQRNSGKLVTSVMMPLIGSELWHGREALPDRLLATRIPFCVAFAIAICADANAAEEGFVSHNAIIAKLTAHGVSGADAIWLTAHILKQAVHRHHSIASRGKGLIFEARRDQNSRAAAGGSNLSNWITARRDDHARRKADHEYRLEGLLNEVAAVWPTDGLSEQQMEVLDAAFVDTPEMRLRLAEKLAHPGNRKALLSRNIDQFKREVGLFVESNAAFDTYFAPEPERLYDLALATARSFVALHRDTPDDLGRRTSNLLAKGVAAASGLLEQPFIRARQPMRWQSALSRTACAVIFALLVVGSVALHQPAVAILRQLALDHAANMLALGHHSNRERDVLDTLSGLSIQIMMFGPAQHDELSSWSRRLGRGICLTMRQSSRCQRGQNPSN